MYSNSDVQVTNDWVTPVIELMEKDKKMLLPSPNAGIFNDPDHLEYAGAAGGWDDKLAISRVLDTCETDEGQAIQPLRTQFLASGAAMFVRASVFHEMEWTDPYFFAHQEEIDLCWRMQLAGYTTMVCPDPAVYQVGGGTLPRGEEERHFEP